MMGWTKMRRALWILGGGGGDGRERERVCGFIYIISLLLLLSSSSLDASVVFGNGVTRLDYFL
ncbi:unnamed protein product [Periconia digitata]|uniref:Uncharacterized protein n=1 Tax=Periconia digitata TaxID=1303443 RepID=A0A9W4UEE2_9PLEO|nr:unnamed protein product [Periconia digitata]